MNYSARTNIDTCALTRYQIFGPRESAYACVRIEKSYDFFHRNFFPSFSTYVDHRVSGMKTPYGGVNLLVVSFKKVQQGSRSDAHLNE